VSAETTPTTAVAAAPALETASRRWWPRRCHLPLLAVLALAAYLDFWRLSQNGYANTYYSAAVRSMLKSWHNFFFVSFDPGGLVSVDKPPLALWVEAASAKVFGYSSLAMLFPEALAGVVAVWLLYLLVSRYFGRTAGLVAALALAVSPVSVAVNRDNNPDALFACLLVAAVYVGARAVESGRLRTVLLSAVLVGLAFNTKMLAALIVVPGLFVAYALLAPRSRRVRFTHLALAGVVLVLVSVAWIAAVELTPASDRPYVGSTTDNSALSLAFGYNGFGRVTGQEGGTSFGGGGGGAFSGSPGLLRLFNSALGDQGGWLLPLALVGGIAALALASRRRDRRELIALAALGGWFLSAAAIFSYSSGIIHTYYLSALAPAACGLVGAGVASLWRSARLGNHWLWWPLAAIVLTAVVELVILRRSDYLSWLQTLVLVSSAVAIAALLAAAYAGLSPRTFGAVVALALGVATAGFLAAPAAWSRTTLETAVNGAFPGAGPNYRNGMMAAGAGMARGGRLAAGSSNGQITPGITGNGPGSSNGGAGAPSTAGNGGLPTPPSGSFGPTAGGSGTSRLPSAGGAPPGLGSTGTPGRSSRSGSAPGLGSTTGTPGSSSGSRSAPGSAGAPRIGMPGSVGGSSSEVSTALAYVLKHGATKRFALIVTSEQEAAPFVIKGESVAAMGGFTGRETVLTSSYLARLVENGEARYFLIRMSGGLGGGSASNSAIELIASSCRKLKTSAWSKSSSSAAAGESLYDCAGRAAAIGNAGGSS
jgi:4-amino-4-deoxy-L-arabinose transferase-like glycosyltransferase